METKKEFLAKRKKTDPFLTGKNAVLTGKNATIAVILSFAMVAGIITFSL